MTLQPEQLRIYIDCFLNMYMYDHRSG